MDGRDRSDRVVDFGAVLDEQLDELHMAVVARLVNGQPVEVVALVDRVALVDELLGHLEVAFDASNVQLRLASQVAL